MAKLYQPKVQEAPQRTECNVETIPLTCALCCADGKAAPAAVKKCKRQHTDESNEENDPTYLCTVLRGWRSWLSQ